MNRAYFEVWMLVPDVNLVPYYDPGLKTEEQAVEYMESLYPIGAALNKSIGFGVVKVTETYDSGQCVRYCSITHKGSCGPQEPYILHPAALRELYDAFRVKLPENCGSVPDDVSDDLITAVFLLIPEYSPHELLHAIQECKDNVCDVYGLDGPWRAKGDIDVLADAFGRCQMPN